MNDRTLLSSRVAQCNAHSSSRKGDTPEVQQPVGNLPVSMSDEDREAAILRASHLVEFFQAERELFEALYSRSSCFGHKGDADRAKLNWQKAVDLLAALLAGRHRAREDAVA